MLFYVIIIFFVLLLGIIIYYTVFKKTGVEHIVDGGAVGDAVDGDDDSDSDVDSVDGDEIDSDVPRNAPRNAPRNTPQDTQRESYMTEARRLYELAVEQYANKKDYMQTIDKSFELYDQCHQMGDELALIEKANIFIDFAGCRNLEYALKTIQGIKIKNPYIQVKINEIIDKIEQELESERQILMNYEKNRSKQHVEFSNGTTNVITSKKNIDTYTKANNQTIINTQTLGSKIGENQVSSKKLEAYKRSLDELEKREKQMDEERLKLIFNTNVRGKTIQNPTQTTQSQPTQNPNIQPTRPTQFVHPIHPTPVTLNNNPQQYNNNVIRATIDGETLLIPKDIYSDYMKQHHYKQVAPTKKLKEIQRQVIVKPDAQNVHSATLVDASKIRYNLLKEKYAPNGPNNTQILNSLNSIMNVIRSKANVDKQKCERVIDKTKEITSITALDNATGLFILHLVWCDIQNRAEPMKSNLIDILLYNMQDAILGDDTVCSVGIITRYLGCFDGVVDDLGTLVPSEVYDTEFLDTGSKLMEQYNQRGISLDTPEEQDQYAKELFNILADKYVKTGLLSDEMLHKRVDPWVKALF